MYVSRLPFHVVPGHTSEVEERLGTLKDMIERAGGSRCRVLRSHFASDGSPDLILEQDIDDLTQLEGQIKAVTDSPQFQDWSRETSKLLVRSPKREAFLVVQDGSKADSVSGRAAARAR
jgi:hypothetical protein